MLLITHNSSSMINSDQLGLILMNQRCDTACYVNDTKLRKMSTYTDIDVRVDLTLCLLFLFAFSSLAILISSRSNGCHLH